MIYEAYLKKYENEFFYSTNIDSTNEEQSCSSGRLSKTIYKLHNYEEDILIEEYRYFSGYPKIGGSLPSAHYCPIAQTDSETTFGGLCSNINNNPNNERGESYSKNSFCALSSLIKNTINNNEEISEEYYSTCFEMFCSSKSLTIKVGEDYRICCNRAIIFLVKKREPSLILSKIKRFRRVSWLKKRWDCSVVKYKVFSLSKRRRKNWWN